MGGGDLNLKKSWHPSTLKNMERVWKAEQKHEAEQKKIEQLQKELAEERARDEIRQFAEDQGVLQKRAERLDWMYQGPAAAINRDEYLMGRAVDKTFELMQQADISGNKQSEGDNVPISVAKMGTGNLTVDLENKIREDPLLLIKKQEDESRKKLLDNPVRMKQLQQLLQKMQSNIKLPMKKKSKKHRRHTSSDSESSESPTHIRSLKKIGKKRKDKEKRKRDSDGKTKKRHQAESNSKEHKEDHSHHTLSLSSRQHRKQICEHNSEKERNQSSRSLERERKRYISSDEDESPLRLTGHHKRSKPFSVDKHNSDVSSNTKNATKHNLSRHSTDGRNSSRLNYSKKASVLSAEERDRRLQEMMNMAKVRDHQRLKNVERYRNEEEKEKELMMKDHGTTFIRPMLSEAASSGSLEGRIKRNAYNIQRTNADLEKNFTKR